MRRILGFTPRRKWITVRRLRVLGLALFLEITEHIIVIITLLGICQSSNLVLSLRNMCYLHSFEFIPLNKLRVRLCLQI